MNIVITTIDICNSLMTIFTGFTWKRLYISGVVLLAILTVSLNSKITLCCFNSLLDDVEIPG